MYHHTNFEFPNAFHKIYMNVQSSKMSTIIYINSLQFSQTPKLPKL